MSRGKLLWFPRCHRMRPRTHALPPRGTGGRHRSQVNPCPANTALLARNQCHLGSMTTRVHDFLAGILCDGNRGGSRTRFLRWSNTLRFRNSTFNFHKPLPTFSIRALTRNPHTSRYPLPLTPSTLPNLPRDSVHSNHVPNVHELCALSTGL